MIEVLSFSGTQIETEFAGEGLWRLADDVKCEVKTDEGVLRYKIFKGFVTNMRSGASCIDCIIPKFTGNNRYNLAILCHDFAYTQNMFNEHFLSRKLADNLLKQMAVKSGEIGSAKAAIMHRAVRMFGGGAYDEENSGVYENNGFCMGFEWAVR